MENERFSAAAEALMAHMRAPERAMRFNAGKERMDLIPLFAMRGVARVLALGAEKYDDWNWAKGHSWSTLIASLMRHLAALQAGELRDPESGELHSDHIAANAIMLALNVQHFPEGNTLPNELLARRSRHEGGPINDPEATQARVEDPQEVRVQDL